MSPGKRLFVPLIVIAALGLGACATNQVDRKQETEQKARDVGGDVWATDKQIDATLVSLNNMVSTDGPQLQQAFNQYSADVDRMQAQSKKMTANGEYMRKQSDTYLTDWQKQNNDIQNQDLRANSDQGRQTVRDRFNGVHASYDNAQTSLDRLMRNFEDVRTAVRNDLTVRGVQGVAATDVIKKTQSNAKETKKYLHEVQTQSDALARALSPSAPPLATTDSASDGTSQGAANKDKIK
jgi:DUF2959 family protein